MPAKRIATNYAPIYGTANLRAPRFYVALGAELRRCRKLAGLALLGAVRSLPFRFTTSQLGKIERGFIKAPLDVVISLASVYRVSWVTIIQAAITGQSAITTSDARALATKYRAERMRHHPRR